MISVNLLPAAAIAARSRRTRTRTWALLCGGYGAVLLGVSAVSAMGSGGSEPIKAKVAAAQARLESRTREVSALKQAMASKARRVEADKAISGNPDWSTLLDLLSRTRGPGVVLERVALTPLGPRAASRAPTQGGKAEGRPTAYTIVIEGLAETQGAVSRYAMALEETRVFDIVRPEHRVREVNGRETISFQLLCEMGEVRSAPGGGRP